MCSVSEVMIVLLLLTAAGEWKEPAGRHDHSTAVVGDEVYLWAGIQDEMPSVYNSAEKQAFLSSIQREHWLLGAAYHTWNTSTGSTGLFLCSCQE